MSRTRNTDKSLYLISPKAKMCAICDRKYIRIVSHMKTKHKDSEVFVSRISPKMADMVTHEKIKFIKYPKDVNKSILHLKADCVFCEESRGFPPHYWSDHLRSHTGEYAYECLLCQAEVCFTNHCGLSAKKVVEHNFYKNALHAFLCTECNFVQINEENMKKHLINEHEIIASGTSTFYKRFTLVPALNSLPLQANPYLSGRLFFDYYMKFVWFYFS